MSGVMGDVTGDPKETLRGVLDAVARGVFPPPDGGTTIVAQPASRDAGVLALTAHSVVFTDEDPRWVRETLAATGCDPLAASMNPRFLTAFAERTGRTTDTVDALLVGSPLPGTSPLAPVEIADPDHPRVVSARLRRDDVRVWAVEGGVVMLGRGVAGRLEVAVEVAEGARHRGLGRALVTAARQLAGEAVWAQVSPGNARSVRAFQAAGYLAVGAEALFRGGDNSRLSRTGSGSAEDAGVAE